MKNGRVTLQKALANPYSTLVVAYIILFTIFGVGSKNFLTGPNLLNIGMYCAVCGVVGGSLTFVLSSGLLDLSAGSIMGLTAMSACVVLDRTGSTVLMVLTALAVGYVAGYINGFLITKMNLMPMIVTLGTQKIYRGLAYAVNNGKSIQMHSEAIKWLGRGYFFDTIPVALVVMAICLIIFALIAKYTVFGRRVYLIGGNAQASFLSGINVNKTKCSVMAINGLMCGLSGLIIAGQLGACLQETGNGYEFNALCGCILGGVSLAGGKGTVWGTLVGMFLLSSLQNGLVQLAVPTYWQNVATGAVLVLSVSIDVLRNYMAGKNLISAMAAQDAAKAAK